MATLGSKDISQISKEELLRAYANAGNVKAQEMLNGSTPTPSSSQSLGSRDIKDISKEEIIDAYAKSGMGTSQQKAKEIQANNYALPSYTPPTTQQPGTPLADATEKLLPEAESRSSLVTFADMLNQATTLARDRRQASELGILEDYGFKPGQVTASTMGQVLNLLQQRTDTSHGALQDAAIQAHRDETQRQAVDMENKQQLALQLIGKVDEATLNGILNAPDFNSAMAMSAGVLKGTGDYTDVRSAVVDGKLSFFGVKDDGTVEQLAQFGEGGLGGVEFKDAQKLELEAAGLGDASREEQLDYLYPPSEEPVDKIAARKSEFAELTEFAAQYPGSDDELKNYLLENKQYVDDGDIAQIVNSRPPTDADIKDAAIEIVAGVWDKDWWRGKTSGGIGNTELEEAKNAAKKAMYKDPYNVQPGSDAEKRILAAIDGLSAGDVENLID